MFNNFEAFMLGSSMHRKLRVEWCFNFSWLVGYGIKVDCPHVVPGPAREGPSWAGLSKRFNSDLLCSEKYTFNPINETFINESLL